MARRLVRLDFDTAAWLAGRSGTRADLDWSRLDRQADAVFPPLLSLLLTSAESDAIDAPELASRTVIDAVRGESTSLAWLIGAMRRALGLRHARSLWDALRLPLVVHPGQWPALRLAGAGRTGRVSALKHGQGLRVMRAARRVGLAWPEWLPEAIHGNPADVLAFGLGRGRWLALWFRRPRVRRAVAASWASMLVEMGRPVAVGWGSALPAGIVGAVRSAGPAQSLPAGIVGAHAAVMHRLCSNARVSLRPAAVAPEFRKDEVRFGVLACRVTGCHFPDRRTLPSHALAVLGGERALTMSWSAEQRRAAVTFGILLAGLSNIRQTRPRHRRDLLKLAALKGSKRESDFLRHASRCRWFFDALARAGRSLHA